MGQGAFDTLIVGVNFDVSRHMITPEADRILMGKMDLFKLDRIESFTVIAHTDADGSPEYNIALSKRRAFSVRGWLGMHGVDTTSIALSWQGERQPVADNTTTAGKQKNRRATIEIVLGRPMKQITGVVADSSGQYLDALIVVRGKEFMDSAKVDTTGKFVIAVPDSSVLMIEYFVPGFIYESGMFNSSRNNDLSVTLLPITRGARIKLHRFYFIGNQDVLLPTSEPELERLLRFMELNPTVVVAIEGHMNMPNRPKVTTDSWEYDLSVRRSKRVHDYLIDKNVNPDRLTFEGFGNWNMMYPKATREEQMQFNRRVEVRVVDY